jgi:hypothetical protein
MKGKTEKVVRKRWLYLYIINMCILVSIVCFKIIDSTLMEYFSISIYVLTFLLFLVGFLNFIFFYFPYVKKGTKLLTCQLAFIIICEGYSIYKSSNLKGIYFNIYSLHYIHTILFFYFSLDLLKFNRIHRRKLKEKKLSVGRKNLL